MLADNQWRHGGITRGMWAWRHRRRHGDGMGEVWRPPGFFESTRSYSHFFQEQWRSCRCRYAARLSLNTELKD